MIARWHGTVDEHRAGMQPADTWFPHPIGPHPTMYERVVDGQRVVIYVACPLCSRVMSLAHAIRADGMLHPSLVCANRSCTWHVFDKLGEWTGGDSPQSGPL